jgi:S-(hydroxymethyl)glutathione dehydrogenase/alcohol dehydrogenase
MSNTIYKKISSNIKFFKAAVLVRLNKPLKIIKVKFPSQLKEGQVLVKLKRAAICGAQINEIKGVKGPDKYIPHMMGHEGYGQVIAIGSKVRRVKLNDNVVMHWRKASGIDAENAKYESEIGKINSGKITTFSEYSIVSENRLTKVRFKKKIKRIEPLFGCAIPTAYGVVKNEAKIKKRDRVLIFGAGGLGLAISTMSKYYGVNDITFVDKNFITEKKDYIKKLNFKFSKTQNVKHIKKLIKSKNKYNQIFETTGDVKNISYCFDLLDKNSNLVLVGQPKKNKLYLNKPLKFFSNIKIFASDGGRVKPDRDIPKILKLMNSYNKFYFNNIISHQFHLSKINQGINLLIKNKALRISINF